MKPASGLYRKLLYDIKLRHKLLLSYLALIIIPLGVFQSLAADKTAGLLERHVRYSAEQGFEQTFAFLRYKLAKMAETTDVIVVNDRIIQAMENRPERSGTEEQLDDYIFMRQFVRALQNEEVARVALYVPPSLIYSFEGVNFHPLAQSADSSCLRHMREEKHTYLWCTPAELSDEAGTSRGHLYLARYIRHSGNYLLPVGRVSLEISHKTILAIMGGANVVRGSVTYLLSAGNEVILSAGDDPDALPPAQLPAPPEGDGAASFRVGDRYYLYHPVPSTQWTMVTSIPFSEIAAESRRLKYELYMWVAAIATFAYLLAYWLAHSITRRISQLVRRLRSIDSGNLNGLRRTGGRDEIGELDDTYHAMLARIERMNREQFKLGQEVKNAELKALQSQINPHFLYNTLDLINWMAELGMRKDIQRIVRALSRFYKLSLNNGNDLITVRDELRHIACYMEIQNMRFDNGLTFRVDMAEELMDCILPKITLQPIVENAIVHGILERPDRTGTIGVTGEIEGSALVIAVTDDGVGMDGERLAALERGLDGASVAGAGRTDAGGAPRAAGQAGSGYGVHNVRLRIRQYFGYPYGLSFRSAPGEGTTVCIRMPAVRESDALPPPGEAPTSQ